ncbi:MAG TPA: translation initiation factor IF-3, partial [Candidatus Moranbacteria bacterium]|nr:translation initiation factor IF-3 [Candidatus Moranbacteria bacterium]
MRKRLRVKINEYISAREARIIDEDGHQLGVMSVAEAIDIAKAKSLDLVEISPKAVPPVCKIMN